MDFASNFHLIPEAINVIQNHGNHLEWNSKTAPEGKNTRVNITVTNRVYAGHMLSLDDGYCTAGF